MNSNITFAKENFTSTTNNTQEKLFAKVAVDIKIELLAIDYFYYSIPDELLEEIKIGTIVHIPFGKQEVTGFVLDIVRREELSKESNELIIKPIYEVIYKEVIWEEKFLNFASWVSNYYLTNLGTILAASISTNFFDHFIHKAELNKTFTSNISLNKDEQFIVDKLLKSKNKSLSYRSLLQKARFPKHRFYSLINNLKKKSIIKTKEEIIKHKELKNKKETFVNNLINPNLIEKRNNPKEIILNKYQESAFKTILLSIENKKNKAFLLHGVTGSGKTEVYIRLIEETLKRNKKVIYLVPEIYLIPQTYQRLLNKFNENEIIIWHSLLSKKERFLNWERLVKSNVKIVLGARSAILSPIKNVGLIVIDEAHEVSYKQASPAPRYNAITLAKKRSEAEQCPLVLGTATPNVSDYHASLKDNSILELPKRIEDLPLPPVYVIDLQKECFTLTNGNSKSKNIISNTLKFSINEALNKKEQIILLLNRRGYSSHIFCRVCGYIQNCNNCSVPLVYHKQPHMIICHHCGFKKTFLDTRDNILCPNCNSPHFTYFGVGTQQLEEEVTRMFPGAKIIRVDSDQLRNKNKYFSLWQEFASGRADILIGTQIVAKGLDLPNITVVGVILADTMLTFPDYVSYEKAFQILTQISGRTGRGEKAGKVYIQTYQAENTLFNFIKNHDYNGFYKTEVCQREKFFYPPFCNLTRIIFQSQIEEDCIQYANKTLELLKEEINEQLSTFLGPAPCFFPKLHGKYRYHIICKIKEFTQEGFKQDGLLFNNLLKRLRKNAKVEVIIDVDTLNLL